MSTPAPNNSATAVAAPAAQDPVPNATCLTQAAKFAIQHDKPIQLDYYVHTHLGTAFLGEDVNEDGDVAVLGEFQVFGEGLEIMAVDGTEVAKAEFLEER